MKAFRCFCLGVFPAQTRPQENVAAQQMDLRLLLSFRLVGFCFHFFFSGFLTSFQISTQKNN